MKNINVMFVNIKFMENISTQCLQYQVCVKMCHIWFKQIRASRPAAQSTPYGRVSPDSHWSLHAARASRADSADRAISARSADEGLSALHCPRHWFALPRAGDRCNLESSNGHSRNPHCLRIPRATGVREARPQTV